MARFPSDIPRTDRSGTQLTTGYLERKPDGISLAVNNGNGLITFGPGRYNICMPVGTNIQPRAGVRGPSGWTIPPEPVVVDFGWSSPNKPVVLLGCRLTSSEWLDTPDDADRVAWQYETLDTSGTVTGYVRGEACTQGSADLSVEATGDVTVTASGDARIVGDAVRLGEVDAANGVAVGPTVDQQFEQLKTALNSWTPVPGDGGAALKAILTTLFTTGGWPANTTSEKVKVP